MTQHDQAWLDHATDDEIGDAYDAGELDRLLGRTTPPDNE